MLPSRGAILLVLMVASLPAATVATNYTVGDEKGWNPDVDYTAWVKKHRPFYMGDWLLFEYQNGRSDVVQVGEVGYDNCDKENAISSHSKGHSYAFQLTEAKDYYFICSYGYCYSGMKLAVTAKKAPTSPPGSKSSAAASKKTASLATRAAPYTTAVAAIAAVLLRMF